MILSLFLFMSGSVLAQTNGENDRSDHLTDGTTLVNVQVSEQKKKKEERSGQLAKTLEKGLEEANKKEAIADQLSPGNEKGKKQGDLDAKEKKALEQLGKGMKGHHENDELGNVEYSRN